MPFVTLAIRGCPRSAARFVLCLLAGGAALWCAKIGRGDDLAERIEPLIKRHKGDVAVVVRHLETNEAFCHRSDQPMPTASLIKLAVMVEAYRQADDGKLDLEKRITLREEDKVQGSGMITPHLSAGLTLTVRDAIRLMMAYSDNSATNLVLDQIGLPATSATMEKLGLANTKIHAKVFRQETSIFPERSREFGLGSTTAAEMTSLVELIYRRKAAGPKACEEMLAHLRQCQDTKKFGRRLPKEATVAHKTGSVAAVRTDAGVIDGPSGPFVICVLTAKNEDTSTDNDNAADRLCGDVALAAYNYFREKKLYDPKRAPAAQPARPLKSGDSGPLVSALQRTLNAKSEPSPKLTIDGEFGPMTEAAVKSFQKSKELPDTGQVDRDTWKALGAIVEGDAPTRSPEEINGAKLSVVPADDLLGPPFVTCKAWAVADAKTGKVLWGGKQNEPQHIASTTKMMTAYIVCELAAKDPKILDEELVFSQRADDTVGSTADVRTGERLTVREALYGLMLPSGNDASVALGEHFGGRLEPPEDRPDETDPLQRFVAEMNRTAKKLDMTTTSYRNTHGMTHDRHKASPADLVKLAIAGRKNELFRHYTSTRQHGCQVIGASGYLRNVEWKNTNQLLSIEGFDGVKTGTTDLAGACLVSAGRRGDDELIVVVLGATSSDARYVDSRNLYRWAWQQRAEGK
ncbi:MAG: serine hydrolase [Planctomycetia bacterium]|nr:serine hydrolase [Planctomycetia bacterium]